MNRKLPRRELLKNVLLGAAALPAVGLLREAHAAPALLDPNDPTAKALGYTADTTKVDGKANPNHTPEQHCGICVQFVGKPTDAQGGCNIFPGKQVAGKGWCKVWAKKPGV
jgi:hypothetical protein